jgi:ABC-2 type transport system permease protein
MTTAKRRPAGAWKERVAGALWENPVLVKEFRTRMRGTRAYWILFAYTLLIASILAFVYHLFFSSLAGDGYGSAARRAGELGRVMYGVVFVSQAIMVALITPALTAGTITIEREIW